ncbi:hypothetical protein F5146DRAFT_1038503, partial [Armillaria mellea]
IAHSWTKMKLPLAWTAMAVAPVSTSLGRWCRALATADRLCCEGDHRNLDARLEYRLMSLDNEYALGETSCCYILRVRTAF